MMMLGDPAMGGSFALAGASRHLAGVVWAFALFGAAGPLLLIPVGALFQEITPTDIRGRVFASRFVVVTLTAPLTTPLVGWGLDRFGSMPVLLTLGGLMGLLALLGLSSRMLREA
jgi:Na+/melibiose symporter-like transporter